MSLFVVHSAEDQTRFILDWMKLSWSHVYVYTFCFEKKALKRECQRRPVKNDKSKPNLATRYVTYICSRVVRSFRSFWNSKCGVWRLTQDVWKLFFNKPFNSTSPICQSLDDRYRRTWFSPLHYEMRTIGCGRYGRRCLPIHNLLSIYYRFTLLI